MTVCEIDGMRTRRAALKAEIAALNKALKPHDAQECPALSMRDFWNHPDVAEAFAAYQRARDVYGCFAPQTEEALATYSRAALCGRNATEVFRLRLDRGVSGRVGAA